ncbi:DeoR/GlpR family DNA-binding transcription regulator [Halobacillus kuroshimensis]|uniref:DeoR/GlpR family DNA-binding transcription regulator n=1 Tax=Halobacillus kuroshimensis TaxID=302481 RepID=UPI00040BDD7F|nr:DeoR/GlpR family DNA-binding transcription regulator [Halobacillus kuroshimensis]
MMVAERRQQIVDIVNEKNSVRVTELSQIFSVTEETIRRDLEKLESDGRIARSHGGAVKAPQHKALNEIPYFEREIINVKEKKEIAEEAVKQVDPGDKILLDASSTAWYMAKSLSDIPITVLTNSIKVAIELSNKKQITVISTGGQLLQKSLSYVGPLAESSLNSYHVEKAFISCKGFDLEHGMSESNELQSIIKNKMMDIADLVYIMVDHNKFGLRAFSQINNKEKVDCVITDRETNESMTEALRKNGIRVIKVEM